MIEGALRKISGEKSFLEGDDFEWERLPDGKLVGLPAMAIAFAGTNRDKIRVEGEAYVIAARGYAFTVFTWAPQIHLETARKQWVDQRAAFVVGDGRASWSEIRDPKEQVPIPGFDLQMALATRVWHSQKLPEEEKTDDPKPAEGPKLLMQFIGGDPADEKRGMPKPTAGQNTFLYVYQMPKADTVEAAYQAMEAYQKTQRDGNVAGRHYRRVQGGTGPQRAVP